MNAPYSAAAPVKCLIVDDLDDNLLTMSALLHGPEVEVLQARSGREALELLLVHDDVALALLDVQMPGMDGFELAELIRGSERTRHIPLIFVTAGAHERQRLFKGYDAGAVDFLFKPIEPWILKGKAQVFFELHRSRQRLAQELAERTETLRMNEMFSAVLAHDLRDPLNAMLTTAQLVERLAETEPLKQAARRMVASGHAMSRMIADVLDLARGRLGGGIPLACARCDLRAVAERVLAEQRMAWPARGVELRTDGDVVGVWDADRLGQVLSNLVGNALQHGDPAQPVEVRIDGRDPAQLVLEVTNGGRIPEAIVPHVFDPFRRGAQRTPERKGLGLGLYIVREIALAHGGEARVDTALPGRTRFVVTLPRLAV